MIVSSTIKQKCLYITSVLCALRREAQRESDGGMQRESASSVEGGEALQRRRTIFAVVGDVHGRWEELSGDLDRVREFLPAGQHIEAILQIGDAEPTRDAAELEEVFAKPERHRLSDFRLVVEGDITFGAPFYFIGGNHEPWATLDRNGGVSSGGAPIAPSVYFLGRSGSITIAGIHIAFLSGIRRMEGMLESATDRQELNSIKEDNYYCADELRAVRALESVDILLTHEWPTGSGFVHKTSLVGDENVRELLSLLRPRASFHGHYHRADQFCIDGVPVYARGRYGQGVPEWVALFEFDHQTRSVTQLQHLDPVSPSSSARDARGAEGSCRSSA